MSSVLKNKNILLGVTGSIAAYKAAEIIRLLREKEAVVYPIMTEAATYFVHPLTFQTLASQEVTLELFKEGNKEMRHISLAELADVLLIAPATANIIGKIANGIADDILTTLALATKAPLVIAPAMNHQMYKNPLLQQNIDRLKALGVKFIGPEEGKLASGKVGIGRMSEPSRIVDYVEEVIQRRNDLSGKTFLVTAGPTRERLDRVRFISNYSSGKMGYALSEVGIARGARVILVSGPTSLTPPPGVEFYSVESAEEMRKKVMDEFPYVDGVIMAAAVSDYRPKLREERKIKRGSQEALTLKLVQNPDILRELGEKKGNKILVGFCAETDDLEEEARRKLKLKNLDLIVANDITLPGAGFGVDTNIVVLIDRNGNIEHLSRRSKREVAEKIWDRISWLLRSSSL